MDSVAFFVAERDEAKIAVEESVSPEVHHSLLTDDDDDDGRASLLATDLAPLALRLLGQAC